ncbi:beta-ketoacyl-ACP synthase III [Arcicella sp. DC2W]|uniref:Beta-ketoacyl-[acyl-carrier-protein] synthase III n=1 Tax=Arcicella gelida TaxID=2984195 RepID=A0ABU5RZQ9_9BACT|nr:beta-ketoacyl-ACP synthase III [Arcicella sp. DC2W]MEA5401693.1 beta-ketoacyl-ACP synthase III [Arcicella sp. DC2W]
MTKITAAITGVQGYVPEDILTNDDLAKFVDTTDEWIMSRTGIKTRHILRGEGKGTSVMAIEAVKGLLAKTNTKPEEIDLLICATISPDHFFPATANIICEAVGIPHVGSYDLAAACSGFLNALVTGAMFIEAGRYKKVVVVGADKMSSIVDYTDRTTCVLFGDGAGAVLLEANTEGLGIQDFILKSDGSGANHLIQKAGGSAYPPTHETIDQRQHYIHQEGQAVFKFAVTRMADVSAEIMERNNLTGEDVDFLVPHQANKRIIDATANRMGIGPDKVMLTIQKYGNTTAATIPLCLWEYESQLKKGDNLILAAFGGGFTWGSIYLKWAY